MIINYSCRDAITIALGNCITSFFAGFVIFSIIGFMAHELHTDIDNVAKEGTFISLRYTIAIYSNNISFAVARMHREFRWRLCVFPGASLAFVAYPEAVARLPISPLWSFLFFFMLLTLGMGTQFTIVETIVTTITDTFPTQLRKRKIFVLIGVCIVCFLAGLILCSQVIDFSSQ